MRCSLDGKNREELFKCSGTTLWLHPGTMKIDEDCIYLSGYNNSFNLIRIPLYGGKIEKVAEAKDWFELSDDSIFLFNYDDFDDYDTYALQDWQKFRRKAGGSGKGVLYPMWSL